MRRPATGTTRSRPSSCRARTFRSRSRSGKSSGVTLIRAFLAALTLATFAKPAVAGPPKPNIVVILADDMGFSDIGCYGGEIHTPNLDRLGGGGLRFTQFYNTGRCCPTRACLLTGLYPHQAGIGHMME
ncbi:MAG: hypothetical protein B7Z73_13795, partial [Planctomycetia bacterium 21-64-5]